jgi:hypothetical protein
MKSQRLISTPTYSVYTVHVIARGWLVAGFPSQNPGIESRSHRIYGEQSNRQLFPIPSASLANSHTSNSSMFINNPMIYCLDTDVVK